MALYRKVNQKFQLLDGGEETSIRAQAVADPTGLTSLQLIQNTCSPDLPPGSWDVVLSDDERTAQQATWAAGAVESGKSTIRLQARTAIKLCKALAMGAYVQGLAVPPVWKAYIAAVQQSLKDGTTPLPVQPAIPPSVSLLDEDA